MMKNSDDVNFDSIKDIHRQTARDVAQQFVAFRDEGFTRAESIHLATLGIQIAVRAQAEDLIEKQADDGT